MEPGAPIGQGHGNGWRGRSDRPSDHTASCPDLRRRVQGALGLPAGRNHLPFEECLENSLGQKGEPHFYKMKQISYLSVIGGLSQASFVGVVTVSSWAEISK